MKTYLSTNDTELSKFNNQEVIIVNEIDRNTFDYEDTQTRMFNCLINNVSYQLFEDEIVLEKLK